VAIGPVEEKLAHSHVSLSLSKNSLRDTNKGGYERLKFSAVDFLGEHERRE
jgi:hypothetical protein